MEKAGLTNDFDLYRDIQARTNGEIYIGVVGPCRTGKSTFIKRFMDLLVIDRIKDQNQRERTIDELPQAAQGKTIMTTEPKFIPKEAAEIELADQLNVKVRLIDCVGYMVDGATGHMEDGQERMVKTPWFEEEIPFTQAAEIGTQKVINDHSTIGLLITTDGSFGELPREGFREPEERTVNQLKKLGKPFVILLNSKRPYSNETAQMANEMAEKYQATVLPVNCEQLRQDDVLDIMKNILWGFPVSKLNFYIPKWAEMLPSNHPIKENLIENAKKLLSAFESIKDVKQKAPDLEGEYVKNMKLDQMDLSNGEASFNIEIDDKFYYENISELAGVPIQGEYQLISMLRDLSGMKREYQRVAQALQSVEQKGYGVVVPGLDEIHVAEPEIIKHGNKFGVKIKAQSPSIHMIRANIETEIAPIIGSEEQANDLIRYISQGQNDGEGVWETNIFGKSVGELVKDGIDGKLSKISDESQMKLQETMQKIVNESNGGLVCIII